jgi:hypothetical protein
VHDLVSVHGGRKLEGGRDLDRIARRAHPDSMERPVRLLYFFPGIAAALFAIGSCRPRASPEDISEARWLAAKRSIAQRLARDSARVANAPPCHPPPLADTTGWRRTPGPGTRYAFLLPPAFTRDTSKEGRFWHGGTRWLDGSREFDVAGGTYNVESFGDQPVCLMHMGGRRAIVSEVNAAPRHSISATWLPGSAVLVHGHSDNPADLTLFWTVLRTMADSNGPLRR